MYMGLLRVFYIFSMVVDASPTTLELATGNIDTRYRGKIINIFSRLPLASVRGG